MAKAFRDEVGDALREWFGAENVIDGRTGQAFGQFEGYDFSTSSEVPKSEPVQPFSRYIPGSAAFFGGVEWIESKELVELADEVAMSGQHRLQVETVAGEKLWPFHGTEAECRRRGSGVAGGVSSTECRGPRG